MRDFTDILESISEALDPEEVIDRLGISSQDLCNSLADEIEANLDKFYDVIDDDDIEYLQDSE